MPDEEMSSHATCQETLCQSSQPAEPLWTDPDLKNETGVCELISTLKKNEKKSAGLEWIIKPSPKVITSKKKEVKVGGGEKGGANLPPSRLQHWRPQWIPPQTLQVVLWPLYVQI